MIATPQAPTRSHRERRRAPGWRFGRALRRLEEAASGDVKGADVVGHWARLLTQFPPVEPLLVRKQELDRSALEEIRCVDSALLPRAAQLRNEGAELLGSFFVLWKRTRNLHRKVGGIAASDLEALSADVLSWIARVREHERQISGLFLEAHFRDRGVTG